MPKKENTEVIPRPLNCFLIYRLEKQKEIVEKCTGANHRDISKIIAKWWKEASEEDKRPFREKARIAKLEHCKLYPNYKYSPKKKVSPKRVYIRKNNKEQFTSRSEKYNKFMKVIYEDSDALEYITPVMPINKVKNKNLVKNRTNETRESNENPNEVYFEEGLYDNSYLLMENDEIDSLEIPQYELQSSPNSEAMSIYEVFSPLSNHSDYQKTQQIFSPNPYYQADYNLALNNSSYDYNYPNNKFDGIYNFDSLKHSYISSLDSGEQAVYYNSDISRCYSLSDSRYVHACFLSIQKSVQTISPYLLTNPQS